MDKPDIFQYVDYRRFLKDMYLYKKSRNPSFSENAFVFAAGFGKNSRGYLGLVVKNKRNLTQKSIDGFAKAMDLSPEETKYFENMVHFNQADNDIEKNRFFEEMKKDVKGNDVKVFQVMEHQSRYLNEWHLSVLRELIELKDFEENPEWIMNRLGGTITREKIDEGIKDLIGLGFVIRNEEGKLVNADGPILLEVTSPTLRNSMALQKHFALKAVDAMENLPQDKRCAQLITLSIPKNRFEDLRHEMRFFAQQILQKYSVGPTNEEVVQMGMQLIQVTY
ncbi:TIGR02147 family protein [Peredibacter starrii]|uniref:TIGR02147 family protein n=1 Tax=Peredibacter starrii TaxID=28202 RepID=A0AAX4HPG8_9BACT|nr:TIGR02147 family protein [Peredibacter starrii]WPU65226.1 TIGR02147 family protein [Peredibacter starrii]